MFFNKNLTLIINLKLYINLKNFSLLKFREIEIKNFGIIYKFIIFIKN